jgi:preprotein translocase subunit SecG
MTILFIILIIIASVVLSLIILVQNPKGGGLAGNVAGFSNQFMGVKQTNDVLEKGTWIFAGVIAVLCIASTMFISGARGIDRTQNLGNGVTNTQQTAPAQQPTAPQNGGQLPTQPNR